MVSISRSARVRVVEADARRVPERSATVTVKVIESCPRVWIAAIETAGSGVGAIDRRLLSDLSRHLAPPDS